MAILIRQCPEVLQDRHVDLLNYISCEVFIHSCTKSYIDWVPARNASSRSPSACRGGSPPTKSAHHKRLAREVSFANYLHTSLEQASPNVYRYRLTWSTIQQQNAEGKTELQSMMNTIPSPNGLVHNIKCPNDYTLPNQTLQPFTTWPYGVLPACSNDGSPASCHPARPPIKSHLGKKERKSPSKDEQICWTRA